MGSHLTDDERKMLRRVIGTDALVQLESQAASTAL